MKSILDDKKHDEIMGDVENIIKHFGKVSPEKDILELNSLGIISDHKSVIHEVLNNIYRKTIKSDHQFIATKEKLREAAITAEKALKDTPIRSALSKELESRLVSTRTVFKSITEGASKIAGMLLPLAASGTISIPVQPLVISFIAFTIAGIGINAFLTDPNIH